MRLTRSLIAAAAMVLLAGQAHAFSIAAGENGGGAQTYCPSLQRALKKAGFAYNCQDTAGPRANIARVAGSPRDLGFATLDVYALEMSKPRARPLKLLRTDLGSECLFMVTRAKSLGSFAGVSARAAELRFVLPPKESGSAAAFAFLQKIDPAGLGRAKSVTYAASTDAALDETLAAGDSNTVTLFAQFPHPEHERFKAIAAKDGVFLPVVSAAMMEREAEGQKIYTTRETQIANPGFLKKGATVVTACTPLVLFTGTPEALRKARPKSRLRHEAMARAVRGFDRDRLVPAKDILDALWKNTKVLSRSAVEELTGIQARAGEPEAAGKPAEEKKP